jgi:recombinational DNA repair protein (RecF pathway)
MNRLKNAKEYGYENKPCDVCKRTDQKVHFYSLSSVLICDRDFCKTTMNERVAANKATYSYVDPFE